MNNSLISWINPEGVSDVKLLNELICSGNDVIVIAVPPVWQSINTDKILDKLNYVHAIHSGLYYGGSGLFEELQAVSLNWNFLSPGKCVDSFSWKATEHFIAFRKETFQSLGGFDPDFTLTASIAEFCYRIIKSGGLVQYLCPSADTRTGSTIAKTSERDVILFAARHLSKNHAFLLKFYYFITLRPAFVSIKRFGEKRNNTVLSGIVHEQLLKTVDEYTAIIPTILRYDYISRSIESLKNCEFPPREIIVVDQTPASLRKPQVYEPYVSQGMLRVFYLDEPGQCISRNLAIREARTNWLLFFEDDTEAWPGMMMEHKYMMEHSLADVSTGVSLAPWKDESYIPHRNRRYHVADVLATGNCFMKRETALEVNGLHPAFDRGPGADDDLGRRLFMAGKLIVFNYKAIQTHHKASEGGMRVHGAWWRTTSTLLGAFPPPTQLYVIQHYYPLKFRLFLIGLFFATAGKRQSKLYYLMMLLLAPIKLIRSFVELKKIKIRTSSHGQTSGHIYK